MRFLLVVAILSSGCKDKAPKERSQQASKASSFWPEAPKPTSTTGTRTFRYKPAEMTGYRIVAEGGTPPSAKMSVDFKMTLDLKLAPGAAPNERAVTMTLVDLTTNTPAEKMKMKLDDKGMFIEANGEPMTFKRDEPGPFDIAGMTDKPFTTLVFENDRHMKSRMIADHPFMARGTGDMLDSALVLFPDLPEGAIAPGHTWKTVRNTAVGGTETRVDVTYDMTYVGDGACPSGAKTCSLFEVTASSNKADVQTEQNITAKVSFGFAGKIFFNPDKGVTDESRIHMTVDAAALGQGITIGATYIVKPI